MGDELAADQIVPDTKDWTWVLERPCPECGVVHDVAHHLHDVEV